jgi:hypothetical protein
VIGVVDLDARRRSAEEANAIVFLVEGSMKMSRDHGSDLAVLREDVPELGLVGKSADRVLAEVNRRMVEGNQHVEVAGLLQEHTEAIELLLLKQAFITSRPPGVERDDRPVSNLYGSKKFLTPDGAHNGGIIVVAGKPAHRGSETAKAIQRSLVRLGGGVFRDVTSCDNQIDDVSPLLGTTDSVTKVGIIVLSVDPATYLTHEVQIAELQDVNRSHRSHPGFAAHSWIPG